MAAKAPSQNNHTSTNLLLLALVVVLAVVGLIVGSALQPGTEFGGADGMAEEAIAEIDPGVQPWFEPLWEPPGGETESLLFALQAALGAGVLGYALGWYRGQNHDSRQKQ